MTIFNITTKTKRKKTRNEINPGSKTKIGEQRGDPKDNDAYFTIQLKVGITLGRQKR